MVAGSASFVWRAMLAGERLWRDPAQLPRFTLKTVKAVVSFAGVTPAYPTWSKALASMKAAVDAAMPFDVALLGCGSYGLPLVGYILDTHKRPAMYIGGGLQLQFGIKGHRWANAREQPLGTLFNNPYWVWPSKAEVPPEANGVEGSAYW